MDKIKSNEEWGKSTTDKGKISGKKVKSIKDKVENNEEKERSKKG